MARTILARSPMLAGAGALAALAGCAYLPLDRATPQTVKVEPVYRIQQPAGTAAGQAAVGRMELAAGRLDAAVVRFRQALQLDPALVEARNGLGIALGRQGRLAEAEAEFRAALALEPESSYLLNNLGYLQILAGRFDDAAASLARASQLDRGNSQTRENLALLDTSRPGGVASSNPALPAGPSDAKPATPATPATAATVAGLEGATLVHADGSRLHQVSPGILELLPAAAAVADSAAKGAAKTRAGTSDASSVRPAAPPAQADPAPLAARLASPGMAARAGFEVSNGVGVRNLAGRMARALGRLGVPVDRVSDYRSFGVRRSEIHYRDGHREAAMTVADSLPVKPRMVRTARLQHAIDVRLVVGRDLSAQQVAWLGADALLQADNEDRARQPDLAATPSSPVADSTRTLVVAHADPGNGWRHF